MRPVDREFRDETSASSEGVQRVIDRLGYGDSSVDIRRLLSHLPEPPDHAAQRLKSRLELDGARARTLPWLSVGLVAAAALLWFGRGMTDLDSVEMPERSLVVEHALDPAGESAGAAVPEEPIELVLEEGPGSRSLDPVEGLRLTVDGSGMVGGSERAPEIRWDRGRIDLEVDPGAGLSVAVETSDARVHVLGTVFSVERSALGTEVSVRRGRVQVDCENGRSHTLEAGAVALCVPASAAGMLGRSRALSADPHQALESVEQGLALEPSDAIEAELLALRMEHQVTLDRHAEALESARAYVKIGGPREEEVRLSAASIALGQNDCSAALPFLESLAPTSPEAAWHYEQCTEKTRTETTQ